MLHKFLLLTVCVSVAQGMVCNFQAQNSAAVLNLTSYLNVLKDDKYVQCSMQGCSGCGYLYSACQNASKCTEEHGSAMAVRNALGSGKCDGKLAFYDPTILPTYTASNGTWTFIYNNGEKCDTDPTRPYEFTLQFMCTNDSWPQASTGPSGPCSYLMTIGSMYTC